MPDSSVCLFFFSLFLLSSKNPVQSFQIHNLSVYLFYFTKMKFSVTAVALFASYSLAAPLADASLFKRGFGGSSSGGSLISGFGGSSNNNNENNTNNNNNNNNNSNGSHQSSSSHAYAPPVEPQILCGSSPAPVSATSFAPVEQTADYEYYKRGFGGMGSLFGGFGGSSSDSNNVNNDNNNSNNNNNNNGVSQNSGHAVAPAPVAPSGTPAVPTLCQRGFGGGSSGGIVGGYSGSSDNNDTNNSNNNNNNNNNSNGDRQKAHKKYFVTPEGKLTEGNTIPDSVPFSGTVTNNRLYAGTLAYGNLGSVALAEDGQLHIVGNEDAAAEKATWAVDNNGAKPNGASIMSCPDAAGHKYLYSGVTCPGGAVVELETDSQNQHLVYSSAF